MARARRTKQARRDLKTIWQHIARDSEAAADRMLDRIAEKCSFLAQFPFGGEARPELGENLRCFPVGSYIIFYRPASGGIDVARVLHGAMDLPRQFEGESPNE